MSRSDVVEDFDTGAGFECFGLDGVVKVSQVLLVDKVTSKMSS